MERSLVEHALARVMAYLGELGLALDRLRSLQALRLVEEVFASDAADPIAAVIEQLPVRFPVPEIPLPPAFPPIQRGSIGYDES